MLRCSFQWRRRFSLTCPCQKLKKAWKDLLPSRLIWLCKINSVQSFVCTSTLIEKTLKENQFIGESKEPTARRFAQFHSPQTERMKKELILTACISSFVLNKVIKLRVLSLKQVMPYSTVLAIPRSCYLCMLQRWNWYMYFRNVLS